MNIKTVNRDQFGLLGDVDYIIDEKTGFIDWRKMVKQDYLVVNLQLKDQIEKKYGKSLNELNLVDLEDKYLLILLGGIKELARLRGFNKVEYETNSCDNRVTAVCRIEWKPNFETGNEPVVFSAIGDATIDNTRSFAKYFLAPIAENRAFVRCVRNFLNINIVGQDEIQPDLVVQGNDSENISQPIKILEQILKKNKIQFESFKNKMIQNGIEGAQSWNSLSDIPIRQIMGIIGVVNELLEKKRKNV